MRSTLARSFSDSSMIAAGLFSMIMLRGFFGLAAISRYRLFSARVFTVAKRRSAAADQRSPIRMGSRLSPQKCPPGEMRFVAGSMDAPARTRDVMVRALQRLLRIGRPRKARFAL